MFGKNMKDAVFTHILLSASEKAEPMRRLHEVQPVLLFLRKLYL